MFGAMTRSIPFFDPELERLFDASFDETLRLSVDDYLRREGMSPSRFGRTVLGNAAFVCNRLTNGRGVKLHTADRIRAFMGETPFAVSGCEHCESPSVVAPGTREPFSLSSPGRLPGNRCSRTLECPPPTNEERSGPAREPRRDRRVVEDLHLVEPQPSEDQAGDSFDFGVERPVGLPRGEFDYGKAGIPHRDAAEEIGALVRAFRARLAP